MNAADSPSSKRHVIEDWLSKGLVQIHLDARKVGVDVPDEWRNEHHLRLNLSYKFREPMETSVWGVHARLRFRGEHYDCKIPWDAIFAAQWGEGTTVWTNDAPDELKADAIADDEPAADGQRVRHLKVIK